MRRGGAAGFSLVELLVSTAVLASLILGASAVLIGALRASSEAERKCRASEARCEAARRLRRDCARASEARLMLGDAGRSGLELRLDGRRVLWIAGDGELTRSAEGAPPVQPLAVEARFSIEARAGRAFVGYRLLGGSQPLTGRALVGTAP